MNEIGEAQPYTPYASEEDVKIQNFYGQLSFAAGSASCSGHMHECNESDNIEKMGHYGIWSNIEDDASEEWKTAFARIPGPDDVRSQSCAGTRILSDLGEIFTD